MKPETNSQNFEEIETENTLSIDEFFKQLEAKEKDLDISSELVIEIDEVDFNGKAEPEYNPSDSPVAQIETFTQPAPAPKEISFNQHGISELRAEIANLQNQLSLKENERVEMFENARRRQNDFENYKKRTERERGETFRNQLSNLAMQMLPVVDNLNRALDSTNNIADEKPNDFQQFFEGIVLVSQQLNEILAEMGVQPIIAVGESFDPHLHEAVATEIDPSMPPNTVISELIRGYRIGDKVIRPSMVKVSTSTLPTGTLPNINSILETEASESE